MALREPIEFDITDKTISPVLCGGLGNILFQIATISIYAEENNLKPLFGYWTTHQSESSRHDSLLNKSTRNAHFDEWGGHIMKNHHLHLGNVYPNIQWFESRPNAFQWWFDQDLAWGIDTGSCGVYYDLKQKIKPPYLIQGYFFNRLYWHHQRDHLLKLFQLDPNITNYINYNYNKLYEQKTISIHLRVANGRQDDFGFTFKKIDSEWLGGILNDHYDNHNLLIFSDDLDVAKKYMEQFNIPKSNVHYIDEDPFICIDMMARCDMHVLSNSTLSFWGAYLDKKQENPYTFIHESFFERHPYSMIPYESWKISS